MAFPTQFTLLTSSSADVHSTAAPVDMGAIANRWAVQIMGLPASAPGVEFEALASCDNINFSWVTPASARGTWFYYETPARYLQATLSQGGAGYTMAVFVVAMSD